MVCFRCVEFYACFTFDTIEVYISCVDEIAYKWQEAVYLMHCIHCTDVNRALLWTNYKLQVLASAGIAKFDGFHCRCWLEKDFIQIRQYIESKGKECVLRAAHQSNIVHQRVAEASVFVLANPLARFVPPTRLSHGSFSFNWNKSDRGSAAVCKPIYFLIYAIAKYMLPVYTVSVAVPKIFFFTLVHVFHGNVQLPIAFLGIYSLSIFP